MKLGILTALLVGAFLLPLEGQAYHDIVFNRVGQPMAGASVAVCSANPGSATPPCTSTLVQTYTTQTGSVACTLSAATASDTSGSGCTMPGITDAYGNYTLYIPTSGMYWVQVYGPTITTNVFPIVVPTTATNFVDLSSEQTLTGNKHFAGGVPYVDVKGFGATGGGSSDDYSFIHLAALASITDKACLYFPAGTYRMDTALSDAVYCVIGDGVHQSILTISGASATNKLVDISAAPDGFKMKGLQFAGPGQSAAGGQIGVKVANSGGNVSDAIFADLYFSGWPNYCLDLEAPIVTSVTNVRCLQGKRGIFYHGGTSVHTSSSYMNQITLAGYDVSGTDYSSWEGNACDTCGIAYLQRGNSIGNSYTSNGHEIGTARNVTVTNVALTTNVATVTYTGDDLSVDWVAGLTVVIGATTAAGGSFNGRYEPTSVTSSTIVYALTHADVPTQADTGTASLFPGDGIVINNSTGTIVSGFYGTNAQQITSDHAVVSGTSNNTHLGYLVSDAGTSGLTQTIDVYMGANVSNTMRINNNLIGAITNLGTNSQTYSNGSWTLGSSISQNGTAASSGFIRMIKTGTVQFKNNAGSGNISGLAKGTDDVVQVGDTAGTNIVGPLEWNNQPMFVFVAGDFTTANNTNLQAITGLTWTMPGSTAVNIPFDCYLQYSQATAAVSDSFGIQDVTTAPTNLAANGLMQTNTTAFTSGPGLTSLATTTATAVITATPSAITTVWSAEMHGVIEQPSGTASAINIMVKTTTGADAVTVKRGSYCRVGPK